MVAVESANGQSFFGSLQLAAYDAIVATAVGFRCQPDVGPELLLGAKAMRRLEDPRIHTKGANSIRLAIFSCMCTAHVLA